MLTTKMGRTQQEERQNPTHFDRLTAQSWTWCHDFLYLFCTSSNFWGWHQVSRGLVKAVSVTKNGKRKYSRVSSSSSFNLCTNVVTFSCQYQKGFGYLRLTLPQHSSDSWHRCKKGNCGLTKLNNFQRAAGNWVTELHSWLLKTILLSQFTEVIYSK